MQGLTQVDTFLSRTPYLKEVQQWNIILLFQQLQPTATPTAASLCTNWKIMTLICRQDTGCCTFAAFAVYPCQVLKLLQHVGLHYS